MEKRIKSSPTKTDSIKKWYRLKWHELTKVNCSSKQELHRDPLNTTIGEQHHDTLTQYNKFLHSKLKRMIIVQCQDFWTGKSTDNSDAKTFRQCLKSVDNTKKGEVFHQSQKKIGCNISTTFIQMNLSNSLIIYEQSKYKGNECLICVWKSDENCLFLHLKFLLLK